MSVKVTVSATAVPPAVAGDFTLSTNRTLTIAAGATASTGSVTMTAVNNAVDAPDKTVTVSATASGGRGVANPSDKTLTITDDEATPTVSLVLSPASISENGDSTVVTATMSGPSTEEVTLIVSVAAVAPAVTGDFAFSTNDTLTIAAGATTSTGTVTVKAVNNSVDAPDKTVTVSATASGGNGVANPSDQTLTIRDDDGAAVVVDDVSAAEGEALTFTVTLDQAVPGGLTVTPSFTDGTATKGTDYTENTAAITFAGTAGETQTLTVSTTEDNLIEGDETFTVGLTVSGTTETVAATDTGVGMITDDDVASTAVALSVSPASVAENGGAKMLTVKATLDAGASTAPMEVSVSVGENGTATKGTDYGAVPEFTVTIPADSTSGGATFTLTPTDDALVEGNEALSVSGTATGLAVTGTNVTITDNDGRTPTTPPTVTVADASAEEGDSITFTVMLDKAVSGGLIVTPSFTDGTAISGTDYTQNTAALAFAGTTGETQTFSVATTEDVLVEGDETFTVGLTASGTTVTVTAADTGTGTITDDDAASAGVTLAVSPSSVAEDRGARTVTVSATLDAGPPTTPTTVTVTVGGAGDGATEGTDYGAVPDFTVTIPAGATSGRATFTLRPIDDVLVEGDETLSVSGAATGLTVTGVKMTITDDDTASQGVALSVSPTSVAEDAGAQTVTVTAALDASAFPGPTAVTVSVGDAGDGATEGTDYAT